MCIILFSIIICNFHYFVRFISVVTEVQKFQYMKECISYHCFCVEGCTTVLVQTSNLSLISSACIFPTIFVRQRGLTILQVQILIITSISLFHQQLYILFLQNISHFAAKLLSINRHCGNQQ